MLTVTLMIDSEIVALLPRSARVCRIRQDRHFIDIKCLNEASTLYDVLGSLGVPPCEVGRVTRPESGAPVDPDTLLAPGESYAVAAPESRDPDAPRFLGDIHLGKLVRLLRVCGLDTEWDTTGDEAAMAERAVASGRLVLSRNRALLKRRALRRAMLIRSDHPDRQVGEVLRRFRLVPRVRLFGRCSRCNGALRTVAKAAVADRIPPKTAKWLDTYYVCRDCDHLFWEGTHVIALRERLESILNSCDDGMP